MALLFFVILYNDFCAKIDAGDKIIYSRIPKNTETLQENTKEHTKKTSEKNWDAKTFLKDQQIQLP